MTRQTFLGFLILALIAACVVYVGYSIRSHTPPPVKHIGRVAERWVVERHKYHGIGVSRGDYETGETWFENERGQRCRL